MLALYRSGRQAEALEVYRQTRRLLVDELGHRAEPGPSGARAGDPPPGPELAPGSSVAAPRQRAIVVVAGDDDRLDDLLALAEPLARRPARELILARLLSDDDDLAAATRDARRAPTRPHRARRVAPASPRTRRPSREATPCDSRPSTTSISSSSPRQPSSSRAAVPTTISTSSSSARRATSACSPARRERADGPDRHAVRRRRARLVGDRGRRVARRSRSGRRFGSSEPRPTPRADGGTPAGSWHARRFSFSRSSESSPSRCSCRAGERGRARGRA